MISTFLKDSVGVILVFNLINQKSFDNINMFLKGIHSNCSLNTKVTLVGNECDLTEKRKISEEESKKFATQNDLMYLETSVTNGDNVGKIFIYNVLNYLEIIKLLSPF